MSSLKWENGKYYRQCKAVILATDKSNLFIIDKSEFVKHKPNILSYTNVGGKVHLTDVYIPQHLYILSDEEIKEGDWCLLNTRIVVRYFKPSVKSRSFKKIIASTDKSLGLPEPSTNFIKKYIEEYNEGDVIENVLVEYDEYYKDEFVALEDRHLKEYYGEQGFVHFTYRLKVNSDNVITIKKAKDTYTKKELSEILLKHTSDMFEALALKSYPKDTLMNYTKNYIKTL